VLLDGPDPTIRDVKLLIDEQYFIPYYDQVICEYKDGPAFKDSASMTDLGLRPGMALTVRGVKTLMRGDRVWLETRQPFSDYRPGGAIFELRKHDLALRKLSKAKAQEEISSRVVFLGIAVMLLFSVGFALVLVPYVKVHHY